MSSTMESHVIVFAAVNKAVKDMSPADKVAFYRDMAALLTLKADSMIGKLGRKGGKG